MNAINMARIYPITADGSQWEVKIHIKGIINQHEEIIGECTFRSFTGGPHMLMGMVNESIILMGQQLIKQVVAGPLIIPAN